MNPDLIQANIDNFSQLLSKTIQGVFITGVEMQKRNFDKKQIKKYCALATNLIDILLEFPHPIQALNDAESQATLGTNSTCTPLAKAFKKLVEKIVKKKK